jgi:hypothetical protein
MSKRASDDELSQGSSSKRRRTVTSALKKTAHQNVAPASTTGRTRMKSRSLRQPQGLILHTVPAVVVQPPQRFATPHKPEEKRTIHLTPTSSFKTPESIDESSTRARAMDPNEGRCLLTNQPEAQVVHVLDPDSPNAKVRRLAFYMIYKHAQLLLSSSIPYKRHGKW